MYCPALVTSYCNKYNRYYLFNTLTHPFSQSMRAWNFDFSRCTLIGETAGKSAFILVLLLVSASWLITYSVSA